MENEIQDGTEHQIGAGNPECIVQYTEEERTGYAPAGEDQFGVEDFMDCASRSPVNVIERKLNYLFLNGKLKPETRDCLLDNGYTVDGYITFSNRFVAIGSGTTRNGNSLKAPIDFIRKNGLIPRHMLPEKKDMNWDAYHKKSDVTQRMWELGKEFIARFPLAYYQVPRAQFDTVLEKDSLCGAGYGWPPLTNGEYGPVDYLPNHAYEIFKRKYFVFDNYRDDLDYVKKLSEKYKFIDHAYRLVITAEIVSEDKKKDLNTLQYLLQRLLEIIGLLKQNEQNPTPVLDEKPAKFYDTAYKCLGKDASPKDQVPDEVACVETINEIYKMAFGEYIGTGPAFSSTKALYELMLHDARFKKVDSPSKGDIIISPTGYGNFTHGHAGIVGKTHIMSNSSVTGTWEANYTHDSWKKHYAQQGGFPVFYFRLV